MSFQAVESQGRLVGRKSASAFRQQLDRGDGQDPGLKINQEDATWDNLQGRLADIYKTRAEKVMFVKGDDPIPFADVASVIDIAHAAGVDKVGLITAKIEAGQ